MEALTKSSNVVESFADRRRNPRVKVLSILHGHSVEVDLDVAIREVSLGGFSVESPVAFPSGCQQAFVFSTGEGEETTAVAASRHCMRVNRADGNALYIAGFEFLPQPAENLRLIVDTLQRLL